LAINIFKQNFFSIRRLIFSNKIFSIWRLIFSNKKLHLAIIIFKQKISIQKIPLKKVVCLNFEFFGGKCKVVSAVSKKVVSFEKSGIALERSGIV
jgi:hypothetical protein